VGRWLRRIRPGSPEAYAFATLLIALATVLRFALGLLGGGILPFATFYPATLFAVMYGGLWPGILAAALGGGFGWWAFLPPSVFDGERAVNLVIYAATSLLVIWGADHHRRLGKKLQEAEDFRKLVVEELSHRLKNKVATIQAIIWYQLKDHPRLRDEIANRLSALLATDDLIMAAQGKGAPLRDILTTELRPYQESRVTIDGPNLLLPPKLALTMALVVHELATNAAKYGALSSAVGRLSVRWLLSDGPLDKAVSTPRTLDLEWRESNGPSVAPPTHRGFGMRLLDGALNPFDGATEMRFETTGLICRISAALPRETVSGAPVETSAHEEALAK
jgi:two-component sensor histidine kinase